MQRDLNRCLESLPGSPLNARKRKLPKEGDRRVVLVSLSRKGIKAYEHHHRFHEEMIGAVVERLTDGEKAVLEKALKNLNRFFRDKAAE